MPTDATSNPAQSGGDSELQRLRRNVAVLFTNIKDSVAYFTRHGDIAGTDMVHATNEILADVARGFGGRVLYTVGDSMQCVFDQCDTAVSAAAAMQNAVVESNLKKPETERVAIGIGLNYGSAIVESAGIFGDVVNVASRLESVSAPRQVVISEAVKQQLDAGSPLKIRYLGKYVLRGREENLSVYELVWNDREDSVAAPHTQMTYVRDFSCVPKFKLDHMRSDGSIGQEFEIGDQISIGRSEGEVTFASDIAMSPLHARVTVRGAQPYVEECSDGPVFYSIKEAYGLQDGDVVRIGSQLFEFHSPKPASPDRPAASEPPPAELISIRNRGTSYPIGADGATIGRASCTYVFEDDTLMSRTHAKIFLRAGTYFVEDLASRNGTFLRVRGKVPVPPGTTFLIGGQMFKLSVRPAAAKTRP